jgi:hypothetical protein
MTSDGDNVTGSPVSEPPAPMSTAPAEERRDPPKLPYAFEPKDLGQIIALAGVAVYVCGFIVVTAYLGQFGVHDYSAFRLQYLVAGSLYCLIVGIFAFLVGRPFLRSTEWTKKLRTHLRIVTGQSRKWSALAVIYNLVDVYYQLTLCVAVSSLILFQLPNLTIGTTLSAVFFVGLFIALFLNSNAALDAGPKAFIVICVLRVVSIVAYLLVSAGPYSEFLAFLWFLLFGLSMYSIGMRGTQDRGAMRIYFIVVVVLVGGAGIFGSQYYSRIRPGIGGGAPIAVQVLVNEDEAPSELKRALRQQDGSLAEVDLLAETDAELLLGLSRKDGRYGQLLRVRRDLVKAVYMKDTRAAVPRP